MMISRWVSLFSFADNTNTILSVFDEAMKFLQLYNERERFATVFGTNSIESLKLCNNSQNHV
jgi:hypothetical protein